MNAVNIQGCQPAFYDIINADNYTLSEFFFGVSRSGQKPIQSLRIVIMLLKITFENNYQKAQPCLVHLLVCFLRLSDRYGIVLWRQCANSFNKTKK